nr:hypothetical protein [Tanacetum cinerariifolium]
VNTPKSDEDRLKLMELMVFLIKKGVCDELELSAARLSRFLLSGKSVVKRSGDVTTRLQALVDKKRIVITEEVVCEILQLDDAEVRAVDVEEEVQVPAQDNVVQENVTEEIAYEVVTPTPTSPSPPSPVIPSSPPHQSPSPPPPQAAEGSSHLGQQVLDKCSTLVLRVEGLETANTAQQLEILKLKASVKKLERINKVKSSKLRRLKKVGTSQRVESSEDVENVFNQGRISVDMETDEGIELEVDQEKCAEVEERQADTQAEIYNIDLDHSSKVLSMQFWNTAMVKRSGDVTRLQALVDKKRIVITEEVVHEILQLDDAEGVICLPNDEIFAGLARMGYEKLSTKLTFYKAYFSSQWKFFIHTLLHSLSAKRTSWNEFSSAMASALIYLSTGQRFNFSKYVFESLVRNVDSTSKFYMYPRFIQLIIQSKIADLSKHTNRFISPVLTHKDFANIRRVGKGLAGVETPLFENMLEVRVVDAEEEVQVPAQDDVVQENVTEEIDDDVVTPTPTSPSPPSPVIPSLPPHQSPSPPPPQAAKGSSHLVQQVLDKCSALVLRVEGLETANTAQQLEIFKLKDRVKKLGRLNKVKSSKLKCLKKVGTSQCVESSEDVENVFNQGRKSVDMETNEGIELEVDQEKCAQVEGRQADTQAEIYNIDLDHSYKVAAASTPIPAAKPVVTDASTPIPAAKPKVLKIAAAAPAVSTRKRKGVVIRDPEEELHTKTPAETPDVKDKGKGILIEDPKPMKKKDQVEMDAENTEGYKMEYFKGLKYDDILLIFQARFDANLKFLFKSRKEMEKEDEEIIKSINETPAHKAAKRRRLREQAKEDEDLKKQLEVVVDEDDDVFIEATPIGRKVPVPLELMLLKRSKENTKCVSAADEELTAAKHKLKLKLFKNITAAEEMSK